MHAFGGALRDARWFQIAGQAAILLIGLSLRAFEIAPAQIATVFTAAIGTQWLCARIVNTFFEWKSAAITAFGICLLLRADELWPLAAAAVLGVASKFVLRVDGKHIFNPSNIGIVALVLLTDAAWTTPGQWGTALWFAAFIAGAGSIVCVRAARLDVPLMFLGAYAAILLARAVWLGDPLSIPLLRLQSGALILFAFFMISDPKTTPDGVRSRLLFSAAAAALAYILQFHFFEPEGLFYSLALLCLVRPLIERFDPAPRHEWQLPQEPAVEWKPVRSPFIPAQAGIPTGSPPARGRAG